MFGMDAIVEVVGKVIDRVFPDPAQAAQAKLEFAKLQQTGELTQIAGQMEINKIEAASQSVFVAGWRPFIGWVCGAAFGWNFVLMPILGWVSSLAGHPVQVPQLDFSEMSPVLIGMLGLGSFRTVEKIKGTKKSPAG